ncbi:MAG TPA: GlmU family protein [Bacteroidales bacterium]|nr:GlmU family protein [Bacteroidales bacterium]
MNYILFDDYSRNHLLPLTFTRPVAELRLGITTLREKWEKLLKAKTYTLTEPYLQLKYPLKKDKDTVLINASVLPTPALVKLILKLEPDQSLVGDLKTVARRMDLEKVEFSSESDDETCTKIFLDEPCRKIEYPWDIFAMNGEAIEEDFAQAIKGQKSQKPDASNLIIGKGKLFIHHDAKVFGATINTSTGSVYIGKGAEVMEGSMIRGPFALCNNSTVKMGAKIYGATTIGPHCKVGGELNNVVIFGYTNKSHEGFIGNSVIGEWCNIGADTNSSNLKNTYDEVRVWSYPSQTFVATGKQFCGLIMGDHSKCGINTMFNTGTVVGVSANIFGSGFQRQFIPSFAWGGTAGFKSYNIDKAQLVASRVYKRREVSYTDADTKIMAYLKELTDSGKPF